MSERDYRPKYVSNRELLFKASSQDLEDRYEAQQLYEYRKLANQITEDREEIQRLSIQKGAEASIKDIESKILRYNIKLSQMESEYPLRYVIQRMREKEKAEQEGISQVKEVPKEAQAKKSDKPKNFFKEHSWLFVLIPVVLFVLFVIGVNVWGAYNFFRDIWELSSENIWLFALNILSIPFAIFGGINLFRGGCMVLEKDSENFGFYKDWHFVIYFILTIIGYIAVVWTMVRF